MFRNIVCVLLDMCFPLFIHLQGFRIITCCNLRLKCNLGALYNWYGNIWEAQIYPRPVHVWVVVNKVAHGQVSHCVVCFSPVSITPLMLHNHYSSVTNTIYSSNLQHCKKTLKEKYGERKLSFRISIKYWVVFCKYSY